MHPPPPLLGDRGKSLRKRRCVKMLVALRRRLCSSVSSIELIKVYTASRSIGSSSCTEVAANVAQDCSSPESKIENGPFASPPVRNILRRRRLGIRRSRSTRDTDAIELALDSVVKIFTVASSPNYFLPWQNKSQRETMGSGNLLGFLLFLLNFYLSKPYFGLTKSYTAFSFTCIIHSYSEILLLSRVCNCWQQNSYKCSCSC